MSKENTSTVQGEQSVQGEQPVQEAQPVAEMKDFSVSIGYPGYTFVGWAEGMFDANDGSKRPFYNMYVLAPVSSFVSEDYIAYGLKADKKKCLSPEVWKGFTPGDRVKMFFDDKQRVIMAALDG